ncbi:hypothetical protein QSE00_21890 [Arenibacter sp. M-2]|uniref:hypothetical protein n=1 Tax=unclassified Arenibacter TaxID=2615047 RepID=UPI000D76BAEF|nr:MULTISPECIES: hypothetical protein [unclassified Arenibacter]MDL5514479.1 hypothetical protein [Arenibacter sp. M-2]PXX28389.1 hypothetical protein C7972_105244 [Arenibacter sp. ARW7G5Y1]|tara:strand:- start:28267 stop:28731 length:465 start_codon:yes stop_codon:yes gene_type:complete
MRSILLFLCLLGTSCSGQKAVPKDKDDSSLKNTIKLQLVLEDNYSGVQQPGFQVVRDVKTLRNFFAQINKTRKPGLPVPQVDFNKEQLLIYCAGTIIGVGGAELYVIEESQNNIAVGPMARTPSSKKASEVATTPFSIYKMPLTPKEISFRKMK